MMPRPLRLVLAASLLASPLAAQSAQKVSIQFAALFTSIERGDDAIAGAGVEPQLRFNRVVSTERLGVLSLGVGGQLTLHERGGDDLRIVGVFLEPRWVPPFPSRVVFPYLSGRVALLRLDGTFVFAPEGRSHGTGYGAGGGIVLKLSRTTNLDAGVQVVRQEFDPIGLVQFRPFTTYAAKLGLSVGLR